MRSIAFLLPLLCLYAAGTASASTTSDGFAELALDCIHREYPNKLAHVLSGDADALPPRELHPVFYGCFDWHSAVHGHWMLARLLRLGELDEERARQVEAALAASFTPARVAGEVAYLQSGEYRQAWERPYGLAWLLQLTAELREWSDPRAAQWAATLAPLEAAVVQRIADWLPKLSYPIRTGEHAQTAFAFGLFRDWADVSGDDAFTGLLGERVAALYGDDRDCPLAYEPSGQDFLSPCLAEADLMRRFLAPADYVGWLQRFLPGIPANGSADWLEAAVVTDKSDGKLAHLDGLNLSRAWMLEGIAGGLPGTDPRRPALLAAAAAQAGAGLAAVTGEDYAGGHWLASFATYLVTQRGLTTAASNAVAPASAAVPGTAAKAPAEARAGAAYPGIPLAAANDFRARWTLDNWDDGGPLTQYVFLNMPEFWPHSVIDRAGPVRDLPATPRTDVAGFVTNTSAGQMPLADYVHRIPTVDAMLVLHRGRVVYEAYPRMHRWEKHLYMSVSKPFASTLVGILANRGRLDVARPVETYLPELADSGWAGVRVIDILDMASGIDCRQTIAGVYTDPSTCYYQFEAALGWLPPTEATSDDVHAWVASLRARRPAGKAYEYTSVNTFVLRWLVERVTDKPYATLIEEEIWQRMGAESDAVIVAPKRGVPIAASGISSTLRDLGRFGLLFTAAGRRAVADGGDGGGNGSDGGGVGGEPVVPEAMLERIQQGGRAEIFNAARADGQEFTVNGEAPVANSWQWDWVMADGDFYKGGYGGQGLYVSPSRDLVVAFFGTLQEDGTSHELATVARQLATSGLFD